jgi:methionyl-tRNA formyltransferase
MEVVLALDAGPIVAQRALPIGAHDTAGTLTSMIAELGAGLLVEVLPAWEQREITPQAQDDAQATFVKPVRREDAIIDWLLSAEESWRRVRAYNPWPIATSTLDGEALRILEAWPLDQEAGVPAGTIVSLPQNAAVPEGAGFAVQCGRGWLAIVRAQRPGRRAVTGAELLRGWRDLVGKRLDT